VVVVVLSGSLPQETNIKAMTESAEPSMIAFFIGELFLHQTIRHKSRRQMY
jgi:hypothetical protein